jgi:hypothetical protein
VNCLLLHCERYRPKDKIRIALAVGGAPFAVTRSALKFFNNFMNFPALYTG